MIVQAETLYGLELQNIAAEAQNTDEEEELIQEKSSEKSKKTVKLNLSGREFTVMERTLKRRNDTLLCKFAESNVDQRAALANFYCSETNSYFFDRNPDCFNEILDFCRFGQVHCPANMCQERFVQELKFWRVSAQYVAPCCSEGIAPGCSETESENEGGKRGKNLKALANSSVIIVDGKDGHSKDRDDFSVVCLGNQRRSVWYTLEDPNRSTLARVLSAISVLFIFLSVIGLILGSLPQCQDYKGDPVAVMERVEQTCVAWFTLEYLARFIVCTRKLRFVRSPLNVIDLMSVIPFYFELIMALCGLQPEQLETVKGALLAMRLLRVIRVARVLKLARYSNNMQTFGSSLKNSQPEFMMLAISMSVSILLFSTTIYYIEKGTDQSPFTTIPSAFWWCIVTMTTVGYGDMVPTTDFGKFVASFATVSGVVVLAYPITLIVGKFNTSYKQTHGEQKAATRNGARAARNRNTSTSLGDPYNEAKELSILVQDGNA